MNETPDEVLRLELERVEAEIRALTAQAERKQRERATLELQLAPLRTQHDR